MFNNFSNYNGSSPLSSGAINDKEFLQAPMLPPMLSHGYRAGGDERLATVGESSSRRLEVFPSGSLRCRDERFESSLRVSSELRRGRSPPSKSTRLSRPDKRKSLNREKLNKKYKVQNTKYKKFRSNTGRGENKGKPKNKFQLKQKPQDDRPSLTLNLNDIRDKVQDEQFMPLSYGAINDEEFLQAPMLPPMLSHSSLLSPTVIHSEDAELLLRHDPRVRRFANVMFWVKIDPMLDCAEYNKDVVVRALEREHVEWWLDTRELSSSSKDSRCFKTYLYGDNVLLASATADHRVDASRDVFIDFLCRVVDSEFLTLDRREESRLYLFTSAADAGGHRDRLPAFRYDILVADHAVPLSSRPLCRGCGRSGHNQRFCPSADSYGRKSDFLSGYRAGGDERLATVAESPCRRLEVFPSGSRHRRYGRSESSPRDSSEVRRGRSPPSKTTRLSRPDKRKRGQKKGKTKIKFQQKQKPQKPQKPLNLNDIREKLQVNQDMLGKVLYVSELIKQLTDQPRKVRRISHAFKELPADQQISLFYSIIIDVHSPTPKQDMWPVFQHLFDALPDTVTIPLFQKLFNEHFSPRGFRVDFLMRSLSFFHPSLVGPIMALSSSLRPSLSKTFAQLSEKPRQAVIDYLSQLLAISPMKRMKRFSDDLKRPDRIEKSWLSRQLVNKLKKTFNHEIPEAEKYPDDELFELNTATIQYTNGHLEKEDFIQFVKNTLSADDPKPREYFLEYLISALPAAAEYFNIEWRLADFDAEIEAAKPFEPDRYFVEQTCVDNEAFHALADDALELTSVDDCLSAEEALRDSGIVYLDVQFHRTDVSEHQLMFAVLHLCHEKKTIVYSVSQCDNETRNRVRNYLFPLLAQKGRKTVVIGTNNIAAKLAKFLQRSLDFASLTSIKKHVLKKYDMQFSVDNFCKEFSGETICLRGSWFPQQEKVPPMFVTARHFCARAALTGLYLVSDKRFLEPDVFSEKLFRVADNDSK